MRLQSINYSRSRFVTQAALISFATASAFGQAFTLGSPAVATLVPGGFGDQYVGIAATPSLAVFTRPFCQDTTAPRPNPNPRQVLQLNSNGSVTVFGTLPDIVYDGTVNTCFENYIAISPSSSNGWTIGDVFVATANPTNATSVDIYRFAAAAPHTRTLFGTYAGVNPQGHSGVGFDNQGPWNNNLFLGGANGITVINSAGGIVTQIPNPTGNPTTVFESIRVAPAGFDGGLHSGWIFGQTDNVNESGGVNFGVWAFGPPGCSGLGCSAFNSVTGATAPQGESINFVPPQLCSFTVNNTPYSYFMALLDASTSSPAINTANPAQINAITTAGLVGLPLPPNGMLIQDEFDGSIKLFTQSGTTFSPFFQYPTPPGVDQEDATIVACPAPPPPAGGCPATQGFWHKACNWPAVTATLDGVTYNGGTNFSMVIGGITYSQADLLKLLPSGSLHSGNYANALSQLVAAVLNLAAGGQHTPAVDTAIANANGALTNNHIFCGAGDNSLCSGNWQATVQADLVALDNYNSAVGLSCTEASGLTLGSCH